jgi:hypothetical protein
MEVQCVLYKPGNGFLNIISIKAMCFLIFPLFSANPENVPKLQVAAA